MSGTWKQERDRELLRTLGPAWEHHPTECSGFLFLSTVRHNPGTTCERWSLSTALNPSMPAPGTNRRPLSLEQNGPLESKTTSSFHLPHGNNISNCWLNCKCPVSHLNKSHTYEIVNCVLRAIPSCKNRATWNKFFFLRLIENTAHIMHDLKHPGGISICALCFKMYNQTLSYSAPYIWVNTACLKPQPLQNSHAMNWWPEILMLSDFQNNVFHKAVFPGKISKTPARCLPGGRDQV